MSLDEKQIRMGFYEDKGGVGLDFVRFAAYVKNTYGYIYCKGIWYKYKNGVYSEISAEEVSATMGKEIISEQHMFYNAKLKKNYSNAIIDICFRKGDMNKCKDLINLKNVMYDIETGKTLPHSKNYYSTIQLNIEYDKEAKCPQFKKFLMDIFGKDKELCKVVQEIMGYIFCNETSAQKFFIFYGTGSNGKSVLLNIITAMLGDKNYSAVSIRDLSKSFSRIELKDVALNCSSENEGENGRRFDSQYIKAISSGDVISAEKKGKDVIHFKPTCKLIFNVNSLPEFSDKSEGFYRRIMIIPFNKSYSIEDGTADIHLEEKLMEELPGIFNFAMRGLRRLIKNGYVFTPCKTIDDMRSYYEKFSNPYLEFWDNNIEIDETGSYRISKKEIYNSFIEWSEKNKHKNLSQVTATKFWMEFQNVAIKRTGNKLKIIKNNSQRYVEGIILEDICKSRIKKASTTEYGIRKFILDDTYDESLVDDDDD